MKSKKLKVIGLFFLGLAVILPLAEAEDKMATNLQTGNSGLMQPEQKTSVSERITLDLKGVDINELFKILSSKSGLTIIATPEVTGRATVFLNNLTFEEALDVVITVQNLAYERRDNLIKVMTLTQYEQAFGKKFGERKIPKTVKLSFVKPSSILNAITPLKSDVGKIIADDPTGTIILIDSPQITSLIETTIMELDQPLGTAVFDLNYARLADIKGYLNELITPGVGQVIIDERSSKAIVTDLPQRLVKITNLMEELDEASRQVMISGEIIQVSLSDESKRGIDWEKIFRDKGLKNLDLVGKFPVDTTASPLTVYQKLGVGTVDADDYTIILKLLEEYGEVRTISRPHIVAVNKEEARILVGTREAFITSTLSQAQASTVTSESVQFVDVGIKLKVVPTIGKDGFITMKIKPEISSAPAAEIITTDAGTRVPIVHTSEAETVVKVKSGAMIMIAGLLKEDINDATKGLPWASRKRFLGGLFGSRDRQVDRSELVIFLTPKLISGDTQLKREVKNE